MTKEAQTQTLSFQAEAQQLLHLVTHSLYSKKEIFLRELISNASDAADKLRFEAISNPALYENDSELKIWVEFDPKELTIIVRDNGIGMSKQEVIDNLGTIAKSGTREFLAGLTGEQAKDANLIGQFGVGFYSAFVISDKVTVKTRRAGLPDSAGVLWESTGASDYSIQDFEKATRGTEVILHLKKDEEEFLDYWRLSNIITKYSDHILLPILMKKPAEDKKTEKEAQFEAVNKATALWTLAKKDIKDEEYKDLYKHISHDYADPMLWSHNKVEGKLDYITLLYIPTHAPFDLWNRDHRHGLKLYVQRVFIMDDAEQLLPNYLRFVRGVVDSKDLPLNVSREILQNNKIIEQIKSAVIKRVLELLEKLATDDKEKYQQFWQAFGQVLKEGTAEDFANREKIAKLLCFASTHTDQPTQNIFLDDYIARMQKEQDKIYYLTAETFNAAKHSPHLEMFRKKGIEVLLLSDRVDEWMLAHLSEYAGKKFQSVAKENMDWGKLEDKETKKHFEDAKVDFAKVIEQMQKILVDKAKEVKITERLTDSPACLVTGEFDPSMHLQRIMLAAGQDMPRGKPTLEINPEHPLVQRLKSEQDEHVFSELTNLLFEQALIAEGGKLDDPAAFVKRMNTLLLQSA
ncbi:MAG: molecular chaperone HtpG [Gammaproteobacteria bacterium]|nr:molecular chaperone HtpG [Gammaproteobacteria bacterium]